MKSPLVDALRLASGQDKAANNEPAEADNETAPPAADAETTASPATLPEPTEVPELALMDATGVLIVEAVGDEDDVFAASQVIAEEAVNEAVLETRPAATEPAVHVAARPSSRRPALARLGMFSPLICLLLASVATASYFLYQSAGGMLQATGIGLPTPDPGASNDTVSSQEPIGPINRFPLSAADRQSRSAQYPAQQSRAIATAPAVPTGRAPVVTSVRSSVDDRAFAQLNAAYAAYESGDYGTAEAAYRRALTIAPRHPNALHGLAAILHRTGRAEEALDLYELLLSVEPGNTEAAAALLAGRGDAGEFATEAEIKLLLQQHPDSAHLHYALGTVMAQRGRWAAARLAYYKALALDPQNAEYQFNLAVSLENLGQYDDARARYEAALVNATDASAIDSQLVATRISMLAERSGERGGIQ